jgi:hypothetical protein
MSNPSTINIADLINLLDKNTLDTLSARLAYVAHHHEPAKDPGQLLFEFIEDCLESLEETIDTPEEAKARLAGTLLLEIEQESVAQVG